MTAPELLAPAGNWECAKAAIANGADAIYFGLDCGFNARARAANFHLDELDELLRLLHSHRVKGYVTFNTLTFSAELSHAETIIRRLAAAGADALLVQDLGVARLIREVSPDLPIHASTQMTMTCAETIASIVELDVERVVLARELSIDEIRAIGKQSAIPLEVFVHGALCVAYSGQCLTSESLGGRSANRGQCAQACRLPYELICDDEHVDLGDQQYLLSPQDLAAFEKIPELIDSGVVSLKVEGRLKTPEYVANICRHYRQAIDAAVQGEAKSFSEREVEEMELSFSRGFSPGWLEGCDHKRLVPAVTSAKQGVLIGHVAAVERERIILTLQGRIKAGDGIAISGADGEVTGQGGRVYSIRRNGRLIQGEVQGLADSPIQIEVELFGESVDREGVGVGQPIYKTDDPALTKRLRKTYTRSLIGRPVALDLTVTAKVGHRLECQVRVDLERAFTLQNEHFLERAHKHAATEQLVREQLGRLGGTPYELRSVKCQIDGEPMIPLSELGKLRKAMIANLDQAESTRHRAWSLNQGRGLDSLRSSLPTGSSKGQNSASPRLHVLCRTLEQATKLIERDEIDLYVELHDVRAYREASELLQRAGRPRRFVTTRILKPGEIGLYRAMARLQPDSVLVRNLAGLHLFTQAGIETIADFSLNATNELTVDWLLQQRAARVTASYDLNRDQLLEMMHHAPTELMEVVIHQHMPMFHMEHCVFCAVLSPGTNKTNCGRPCDRHVVELQDRTGVRHQLTADVGCRNTLYNATPQSGAEAVNELLSSGVRHFRVELSTLDRPSRIVETVDLYLKLIRRQISGREVWQQLRAANVVGVTRGTMEERRNPLAII